MHLDRSHPAIAALHRLAAGLPADGGSFGRWLPDPRRLSSAERMEAIRTARGVAIDLCMRNLTQAVIGVPSLIAVRKPDGQRLWPKGCAGSLSHKGTVVIAVLVKESTVKSVGVDLEILSPQMQAPPARLVASEGLPGPGPDWVGRTVAFSAKEAVFKAAYPLDSSPLRFEDIALSWRFSSQNLFHALATCRGDRLFTVRCELTDRWLVSTALPTSP